MAEAEPLVEGGFQHRALPVLRYLQRQLAQPAERVSWGPPQELQPAIGPIFQCTVAYVLRVGDLEP